MSVTTPVTDRSPEAGAPPAAAGPVLYVLKRFPRLSETFVLRELLTLEAMGERISIDSLLPAEDGPHHPDVARLRAPVRYVPKSPRLRDREIARVHLRSAVRKPGRWLRLALRARRAGTWHRFLQAGLVADRARREGARHIHAHFLTAAAEVARDAAALAGLPVSVTAHAKDVFQEDNAALVGRRAAGLSDVVTVSDYNARHLRHVIGDALPVHIVPNGVEPAESAEDRPAGPVLCVARLVPKKGVDVLIEATARLAGHIPELRVEIIGGGPEREALEERVRLLGLDGRVAFLGPRPWDEVEAAYGRCSMVVLPCRVADDGDRDGMPTVLSEALARGLPVVSTRVAGIPELVRDGETGLLVDPDDPAGLAVAIQRLRRDRDLAGRLGRAGRAEVAERFDPRRCAVLLLGVFRAVRT